MKWFSFGKKKKKSAAEVSVLEVTDQSFEVQVIHRSYKTPVMVDFWAAWCGPCRQLGPVLENLAEEADSPFVLAKLDTEHNQRMARKYGIRSIPAVKMFRNGRIVDEFTGVLPAGLVRRFVNKTVSAPAPATKFQGSDDPIQRLEQAKHQLKKGNGVNAFTLLNSFPESDESETAVALLPLARFMMDVADGDALTGLEPLDKLYQQANLALKRSNPKKALALLAEALSVGEEIDQPYIGDVMQALFTLLGENHKLTKQYQAS
ncbi:thioredoxin family protein [Candidatus Leptofilum sp.]|uniref:thioredoxin family protein n=1 Tax=Candidatus Leptofilum sp. TaxID=3241576 RepID=UPI003B596A64